MGFCLPTTEESGDVPQCVETALKWHGRFVAVLPRERLRLRVGARTCKVILRIEFDSTLEPRVRDLLNAEKNLIALATAVKRERIDDA